MMAMIEIKRKDRRGMKPEHVLYMAMKMMCIRLTEGYIAISKLLVTQQLQQ